MILSSAPGRRNVVCFENMTSSVINDEWYEERDENLESDSRRITVAAAKLIRNLLRDTNYDMNSYPNSDALCDNEAARKWRPSLLMEFMDNLVSWLVVGCFTAHQLLRSLGPGFDVDAV